jgi:hypothetical protein
MNVNPIARIEPGRSVQPAPIISFADHLSAAQQGLHICSNCYKRVEAVYQQHKCKSCLQAQMAPLRHLLDFGRKT